MRKKTTEYFIEKAKRVHGSRYDYSKSRYENNSTKLTVTCPRHGDFEITPGNHYAGKACKRCAIEGKRESERALYEKRFLYKVRSKFNNKYDYSLIEYRGNDEPITIICPQHGKFEQTPATHGKSDTGCPNCSWETLSRKHSTSREHFIEQSKERFGNWFDYSKVEYYNNRTLVTLICPVHGEFQQTPNKHLFSSCSCPECARIKTSDSKRRTREEFLEQAYLAHGDKYDYTDSEFVSMMDPITIRCPMHGEFTTLATTHVVNKTGCPTCGYRLSKAETEIADFIRSYGYQVEESTREPLREVLPRKEIDIWVPELKLAIEYCGLVWHSDRFHPNPSHMREKHDACERAGFRLITILEDEFREKPEIIYAFLRHLLGKSERGHYARNCTVSKIRWKKAKDFLNQHHLQGSGPPCRYNLGAFDPDGTLIAVMTFGKPSDERGSTDLIEMKRFVTDKRNHPGLASKMFKHAIGLWNFDRVIAFVDRRWFTGQFKSISGFKPVSVTASSLFWTDFKTRYHRRYWSKSQLLTEHPEFDPSMSKQQLLKQLGYYRIWDCGRIKMEWSISE